jgi:hypothetical protein
VTSRVRVYVYAVSESREGVEEWRSVKKSGEQWILCRTVEKSGSCVEQWGTVEKRKEPFELYPSFHCERNLDLPCFYSVEL